MTEKTLLNLIKFGESENLEFKSTFNKEVTETLVSFANSSGGYVLIGVSSSAKIIGVDLNDESVQNWINEIKSKTNFTIVPEVFIVESNYKKVVALKIDEYPIKPVSVQGKHLKRIANSNHLMSVDEISNEHLRTLNSSWDFYKDPFHNINDIDLDKVRKFIRKIEINSDVIIDNDPIHFLTKIELIRDGQITLGAYLLFAKDYCLISDIQVGRFKSETAIIDAISLNTDLFTEVENVIAFIKKHLMVEYIITGAPERIERFDYPLEAIREIVINMIVHRDYRNSNASIIKIFDNRIEFYNPGTLFGNFTINDLLTGNYTSKSRNKLIARAFKEVKLIERFGSGIKRIFDLCKNHGIIAPVLKESSDGITFIVFNKLLNKNNDTDDDTDDTDKRYNNDTDKKNKLVKNIEKQIVNDLKTTINDTDDDTDDTDENIKNDTDDTDERLGKIVTQLQLNPKINLSKLSTTLSISTSTVQRLISKLKKNKQIKRIGDNKTGYWKIIDDSDDTNDTDARIPFLLTQFQLNPEITIFELSEMTKKAKSTILRDIEKLKKLNKIERIGSKKTGRWKINETD